MENCLIDFAYRNICFLDFLNASLVSLNTVDDGIKKGLYDIKKMSKQLLFRTVNDSNLLKYQTEEKVAGDLSEGSKKIKVMRIGDWAKCNKINLSKEIKKDEINTLVDKLIYPKLIDDLKALKEKKNPILQLLFPQVINNLFASFELLQTMKKILISDAKIESDKYSKLFLETDNQEQNYKSTINTLTNNIKISEEKVLNYENKIKSLEETIEDLESKKMSAYYGGDNFLMQEYYESSLKELQNEIKSLKDNSNMQKEYFNKKLEEELDKQKEIFEAKLKQQESNFLEKLKLQNDNFEKRLDGIKANIDNMLYKNYLEISQKLNDAFKK